jgi:hypothetical protein
MTNASITTKKIFPSTIFNSHSVAESSSFSKSNASDEKQLKARMKLPEQPQQSF